MNLPKTLGEVTVSQYMRVCEILKNNAADPIDRYVSILSVLSGQSEAAISALPIKELTGQFKSLPDFNITQANFKISRHVVIGRSLYKGLTDLTGMTSDRYRDIKTFWERGIESNLHNLLACVYSPYGLWSFRPKAYGPKAHKQTANRMLDVKLKDVCGLVFFYSLVLEKLSPHIEVYLEKNRAMVIQTIREAQTTLSSTAS